MAYTRSKHISTTSVLLIGVLCWIVCISGSNKGWSPVKSVKQINLSQLESTMISIEQHFNHYLEGRYQFARSHEAASCFTWGRGNHGNSATGQPPAPVTLIDIVIPLPASAFTYSHLGWRNKTYGFVPKYKSSRFHYKIISNISTKCKDNLKKYKMFNQWSFLVLCCNTYMYVAMEALWH